MTKSEIKKIEAEVETFLNQAPTRTSANTSETFTSKRRHKKHQLVEVSINSLLDVLSVILVFLMKSYSTTTVQVKPSKELQVPFSHSSLQVEESTSVTLTLKGILIDDFPVVTLDEGQVPEASRSSGGMMIDPLFDKLKDEVAHLRKIEQHNKAAEFKGIVSFIIDRNVPFALLAQAMYTAGQAEYSTFKFVMIKSERL